MVVTDIRMPGVNGLEILEGTVDSPVFPPVILITAFGDADTHADALRLGAWTILDKPFDMEDLVKGLHVIAPLDRIGAPTE